MTDMEYFLDIRKRLFEAIGLALKEDSHCKSYEGTFKIIFPNYFQNNGSDESKYIIELGCYVVGPSRHYEWSGKNLWEALYKCNRSITAWISGDTENKDGTDFCGTKLVSFTITPDRRKPVAAPLERPVT